MAVIQSGAGSSLLTVDPTSLAARETEYDTAGNPYWNTARTGAYCGRWSTGILGTVLGAAAPIAAIYNGATSTKNVDVTRILINFSVSAVFTAGSNLELAMQRFSVAAMAGGTAYNVIKMRSAYPASQVTGVGDLRAATTAALTVVGVTLSTDYVPLGMNLGNGAVASSTLQGTLDLSGHRSDLFRLAPGEGLAMINLVAFPGTGTAEVSGVIFWDER